MCRYNRRLVPLCTFYQGQVWTQICRPVDMHVSIIFVLDDGGYWQARNGVKKRGKKLNRDGLATFSLFPTLLTLRDIFAHQKTPFFPLVRSTAHNSGDLVGNSWTATFSNMTMIMNDETKTGCDAIRDATTLLVFPLVHTYRYSVSRSLKRITRGRRV